MLEAAQRRSRPGGRARLLGLHAVAARGGADLQSGQRRTFPHRDRHRGLLYCSPWTLTSGRSARTARSRGCARPTCPAATAASTACTASSCGRCARTAASTRRSCACHRPRSCAATTASRRCWSRYEPRRAVDPERRLRPPARAGQPRSSTPARRSSTSTSWTATSSRRSRWGRWPSRRCAISTSTLDVHLMIEQPERHVAEFAKAGAHTITFHAEATPHVNYTVAAIRELGCQAGVAVCPATPPDGLRRGRGRHGAVHDREPGLGRAEVHRGRRSTRSRGSAALLGRGRALEVDGGIDVETAGPCARRGRDAVRRRARRCSGQRRSGRRLRRAGGRGRGCRAASLRTWRDAPTPPRRGRPRPPRARAR